MIVTEQTNTTERFTKDLTRVHPKQLTAVMIELTNQCNLRCVFCTTSHSKYRSADMPIADLKKIIQFCMDSGIKNINVSGHGETTIADGWEEVVSTLLRQEFQLSITSNLAKTYNTTQIDLLSRFAFIGTSIDSMDRKILQKMRRNVDLRAILYNIQMIRSHALAENRRPTQFGITSVVFQENFYDLDKIVGLAASLGNSSVFVNSPIEFEGLENKNELTHPMQLRGGELRDLIEYVGKVIRLSRSLGIPMKIDETLVDFFATAKRSGVDNSPYQPFKVPLNAGQPDEIMMRYWSRSPGPGQTRLCLDPWSMLLFERHGSVLPCCIGTPEITRLASAHKLDDIINCPKVRQLRHSLLSGDLMLHCKFCARKPLLGLNKFQKIIEGFFNSK